MSNFELFLKKITPFFELNGFLFKKSKKGFYKFNDLGDILFVKFQSNRDTSLETTIGISLLKFDVVYSKYITPLPNEGTLYYKPSWVKYYHQEDDYVLQHTEIKIKEIYYQNAIPFFEQNKTLDGILNSLNSYELETVEDRLKKGKVWQHNNYQELNLFLTKILIPLDFEKRIIYYKNSFKERIEQTFQETGKDYRHNIAIVHSEIDNLVSKIENLDIEKIRNDLKES